MNAPRIVLPIALLLIAASSGAQAQDKRTLAAGDRVRLTAPSVSTRQFEGEVVALRPDTLVVDARIWERARMQWRQQEAMIPLQSLTALEISRGKKSNVGKGALTGGLIGAGIGLVIGIGAASEDGGFIEFGPEVVPAAAVTVGACGAGIGALIGLLSPGERWEEVPLDQLRVGPSPVAADGVAVSLSLQTLW
ncbi:MAG: hypothetical protein JSU87_06470 [Gemmatimonadota bacterium]|nr:MAG: hypothetical protein JSU87_06470 [Gemmatimonadota bacterium]